MSDDVWKRDEVQSPCIKICVIHPEARLCTGCLRSIDEITQWSKMSAEARTAIMAELPGRTAPDHQTPRRTRCTVGNTATDLEALARGDFRCALMFEPRPWHKSVRVLGG